MFCSECGIEICPDYKFCPDCGHPIETEPATHEFLCDTSKYRDSGICGVKNITGPVYEGILVIDSSKLVRQFGATRDNVIEIINDFIVHRARQGICYHCLDLADYLSPAHPVSFVAVARCINRLYKELYSAGKPAVYLFLIGGYDMLPMVTVAVPGPKSGEPLLIDSDIPYQYLYTDEVDGYTSLTFMLLNQIKLFVGRLPLASDTSFPDFKRMLNNILIVGEEGLPNRNIHFQCDPAWKKVTHAIAAPFIYNYDVDFSENSYFYKSIMLSPECVPGHYLFNYHFPYSKAAIFFYNLHGSNDPGVNNYIGVRSNQSVVALTPDVMKKVDNLNIVITEACYGGWFRESFADSRSKSKEETVLLSAMNANTVLFMGASEIAYGALDDSPPNNIDVLTQVFLKYLMEGYSAGVAFNAARRNLLLMSQSDLCQLFTVLEVNLFGDPSLSILPRGAGAMGAKGMDVAILSAEKVRNKKIEIKEVYSRSSDRNILRMVRGMVDSNMDEINRTIQDYLYSHFGMTNPRLDRIVSYKNLIGEPRVVMSYNADGTILIVEADRNTGEIKCCLTEKLL